MSCVTTFATTITTITRDYLKLLFVMVSLVGMIILHGMELLVPPPARYPDLYPALFSIYGAANLVVVYVLGIARQWCDL